MKVTINNLTINIGQRTAQPSDLLESLLRNAVVVPAHEETIDEDGDSDDVGETHTKSHDELVAETKPRIVEFLQPTEKFSHRTWSALNKGVGGGVTVLAQALKELVLDGVVQTKRRRSDGETLYSTSVGAYVSVPPRQQEQQETGSGPELNVDNLVKFLKSDDRYEFRTFDAIKRHFDGFNSEDIRSLLVIAQSTDAVIVRNRADGTSVYKAA